MSKNKNSKIKSDTNKLSTFERVEQEYEELKKRVKQYDSEKTKSNQRSGLGRDSG